MPVAEKLSLIATDADSEPNRPTGTMQQVVEDQRPLEAGVAPGGRETLQDPVDPIGQGRVVDRAV